MIYEQRVEAFGDVCLKFTTLFESNPDKLEHIVAKVLAIDLPQSEEPIRFYLQQIYAHYKPIKGSWLFKQAKKTKKQPTIVTKGKSRKMNKWITELQQLKIQERAAIFAANYLQLSDGATSELMQTPIKDVRDYTKNGKVKLERILEKHDLTYINETNFKKYFDEDFASTYNVRRRLKQIHVVADSIKVKSIKPKRQVPNWVPIVLAICMFFTSLATPFAYHQSKKIPYFNEKLLEAGIIMNSTGQPYYETIYDNYKIYIDHAVYLSATRKYIREANIDMSAYESELEKVRKEYEGYRSIMGERLFEIQHTILSEFGLSIDDYLQNEIEIQAFYNIAYNQLTPLQQQEMHEELDSFKEKYKDQVDQLYTKYAQKYDSLEEFKECTSQNISLKKETEEFISYPSSTELCIMPNGDVTYLYLSGLYEYFTPLLHDLESVLEVDYNPFNYYLFYDYLVEKDQLTKEEQEFLQMTQILAYAYELTFPGWIESVPPLKSEDLIFIN